MELEEIKVHFDGACQPQNPGGTCSFGVHINHGNEIIRLRNVYHPKNTNLKTTNNLAEYAALYFALKYLLDEKLHEKPVRIFGDSKLVINQVTGVFDMPKEIDEDKPYTVIAVHILPLVKQFKDITFTWVPRKENTFADRLAETAYREYRLKRKLI